MPKIERTGPDDPGLLKALLEEARAVAVAEHRRAERYHDVLQHTKIALMPVAADGDERVIEVTQRIMGALPWGDSSEVGVKETVEVRPHE